MEMVLSNNFAMLNETEMLMVDGGDIDWGDVGVSAAIGAGIGLVSGGLKGAGCGTVVMPVIGTVAVGAVCAAGGLVGGAVLGATKSILNQAF